MDCLFCKIVSGEIPSNKVYEDEQVLAFYDIEPQAPVHLVLIPKQHIASPAAVTPQNSAVLAHLFEVIPQIAASLRLDDGFRIVANCGVAAGQSVPHLHFHLLAGRELGWPPG